MLAQRAQADQSEQQPRKTDAGRTSMAAAAASAVTTSPATRPDRKNSAMPATTSTCIAIRGLVRHGHLLDRDLITVV
jgi:hypothetical protein